MKVNLPQLPPRCPPFVYGEVKEVLAADGTLDGESVDPKTAYTVIKELKVRPRFSMKIRMYFFNKNHPMANSGVEKLYYFYQPEILGRTEEVKLLTYSGILSQQLKLCCLPGYTAGYVIAKINVLKY
jgi:hypothetical protein